MQNSFSIAGAATNPLNWISDYRHSFQGQEKDDEIKGEGNSMNYKYRMHDTRIGRFFALDPLGWKYPHNSPYAFSENQVIHAIELEGLETSYDLNFQAGTVTTNGDVITKAQYDQILGYGGTFQNTDGNQPTTDTQITLQLETGKYDQDGNKIYQPVLLIMPSSTVQMTCLEQTVENHTIPGATVVKNEVQNDGANQSYRGGFAKFTTDYTVNLGKYLINAETARGHKPSGFVITISESLDKKEAEVLKNDLENEFNMPVKIKTSSKMDEKFGAGVDVNIRVEYKKKVKTKEPDKYEQTTTNTPVPDPDRQNVPAIVPIN